MQNILKEKLLAFIVVNNPDLSFKLHASYGMTVFLEDKVHQVMPLVESLITMQKPQYIIEELALNEMTEDLRPSRFNYVKHVLEKEFQASFNEFSDAGVLTYECINLVEHCEDVFDTFGFNEENEGDRFLLYAVIAKVHEYLN